jgi:hypothetical protein
MDAMTLAVINRITGNATVTAVVTSSSVRWMEQDRDTAFPFITLAMSGTEPDGAPEGFNLRAEMVDLDVHVYVESQRDNSTTPTVAGSTISSLDNQIKGDWDEQASGAPSYGFDHWTPTLTGTSWVSTPFRWMGTQVLDEPGIAHHVHTFRCYPNKAGVRT